MGVKCPKCQTDNPSDSKYCKECATPLSTSRNLDFSQTKTLETPIDKELPRGTTFAGRYEIIEELGHGGMGKVYKVFDRETDSKVALKLIKPEVAADKNTIERFRNELKVARDISHKHICRMYDLGRESDNYFITMEYVSGEDLRGLIKRTKRLDVGTAISIAKQVCEGLGEAHRVGVVHRDLKPSNIMIDREGDAKIMDFGIARSLRTKGITGPGVVIGTPEYMSPEQVDGKEADERADLYSLSIILYEMVTGKVPFEGETAFAIGLKQKSEPPEDPKKLNSQIPDDLSRLILKGLEKDREKRYQSAVEVLSELTRIEQGLPTSDKVVSKRKIIASREITVHFSLRKLLIPGLALAATGTAIILIIVFFISRKSSEPPLVASQKQLSFTGNATCPAIAPDGKFFAYAISESYDEKAVFVQDMVSGQRLELLRCADCRYLRWTPDGSEISFWAIMKDSSSGIFVVPRLGGTPRRLVTDEFLAWSPDGSQFASCNADSKEIRITNKTTGESTTIGLESPFGRLQGIDWSPNASFLLLHSSYESHKYAIWTISIDGREQNKVFEGDVDSPRWSSRECAIYSIRYKPQALFEILKIPISKNTGKLTKPPSIILSQPEVISDFTITSDGKKLLYAKPQSYSNLWQVTVTELGKAQSVDTKQLTKGTFYCLYPNISQDGKTVAFSKGWATTNIYVMPLEGGSLQQITYMNSLILCPVWSPDGREIAFNALQEGAPRVWKVSAQGENPYQFKESKLTDVNRRIAWTPGKNILYPGPDGFIFLNPNTGEETPLLKEKSDLKIYYAQYSPDGGKIAVLGSRPPPDFSGLWVISLEDSSQVFLREGDLFPIGWSPDGKWVYVSEYIRGTIKIIAVAFESKEAKTVFTLPFTMEKGQPGFYQVTMTPDAKRFVFPVQKTQSDVWVIENFDQINK